MHRAATKPQQKQRQQKRTTTQRKNATKIAKKSIGTLVIADSAKTDIRPTITAAKKIGQPITVLAIADDAGNFSNIDGVTKVLTVATKQQRNTPEILASVTRQVQDKFKFTHILAPSSVVTKDFMPRVAATSNAQVINDLTNVVDATTFVRNTYAGNAISTVKTNDAITFATIRSSSGERSTIVQESRMPKASLTRFSPVLMSVLIVVPLSLSSARSKR